MAAERYFIDDFGYLWTGPCDPSFTGSIDLRFSRFEGINENGQQHWIGMIYLPLPEFCEITQEQACAILVRHYTEHEARKRA